MGSNTNDPLSPLIARNGNRSRWLGSPPKPEAIYRCAGHQKTNEKNINAFHELSIVPKCMFKTTGPTYLSIVVFKGMKWEQKILFPIAMAPVGVLKIFHSKAETAATVVAAKEKVPYILSTASSTSIEDVAKANGEAGMRWYQLYWPTRENDDIMISMLQRARRPVIRNCP